MSILAVLGCSSASTVPPDAGGSREAGGEDRKTPPHREAAADSPGGADAGACSPAPLSSFVPVAVLPAFFADCTDTQITAIVSACFGPGSSTAMCTPVVHEAAYAACAVCVYGENYSMMKIVPGKNPVPAAQFAWGPEVEVIDDQGGGVGFPNTGACVALFDPANIDCAEALTNALQCQVAACAANCTLPNPKFSAKENDLVGTAFDDCTLAAVDGECDAFASEAVGVCAAAMKGPAAFCFAFEGNDPVAIGAAYTKLIRAQCGGATADAGLADAGKGGG